MTFSPSSPLHPAWVLLLLWLNCATPRVHQALVWALLAKTWTADEWTVTLNHFWHKAVLPVRCGGRLLSRTVPWFQLCLSLSLHKEHQNLCFFSLLFVCLLFFVFNYLLLCCLTYTVEKTILLFSLIGNFLSSFSLDTCLKDFEVWFVLN